MTITASTSIGTHAVELPDSWVTIKLRFLIEVNPATPAELRAQSDRLIPFIPMEALGEDGSLDLARERPVGELLTGYSYFANDDVLMAKVTPCFENGKAALVRALPGGHGFGSTEITTLRASEGLDPAFLYYLVRSDHFRQASIASMTGAGGLKRVPDEHIRSFETPVPPELEQKLIAGFLDRETAKIDALIDKQEQLIATLREDRAATITHAVTKGPKPGMAQAPSGIQWMGYVPAHWEVARLRHHATMKTGHTPSRQKPEFWENTHIPWFTLADVWQLRSGRQIYLGETAGKISSIGLANSAAELLPAGTVILSRTASVGFSGIMPIPMATSQDFWNWICGPRLIPEFLAFVFRAMKPYFDFLMMGSTHQTIYQADAAALQVPLPPVDEQNEIVEALKIRTRAVDSLIDKSTEMIETLREYRSALITNAVTGKIDVREAV